MDKAQDLVNELRAVCNKYGVVLIGGCSSEGVYGEIVIVDAGCVPPWLRDLTNRCAEEGGELLLKGIGDAKP